MDGAYKVHTLFLQEETIQGFGKTVTHLIGEHVLDGDDFTIDRTVRPDPDGPSGVMHEGLIVIRRPFQRAPDTP